MSGWALQVLPQAERDLLEIGERLEGSGGRDVARKWLLAIEQAIVSLGDNPYLGTESDLIGEGRRRLILRPYLIVPHRIVADCYNHPHCRWTV